MNVKNHSYRTRKSRIIREVVFSELKVNCRSVVWEMQGFAVAGEERLCSLAVTASSGHLQQQMGF